MRATRTLICLVTISACGANEVSERAADPVEAPAPRAEAEPSPPAERIEPTAEAPVRPLASFPEPWAPSAPVALDMLITSQRFVTRETSALCPTRDEAERRACGDSIEFADLGLALRRGDSVTVVGTEPFDGHWRAIRFQVGGTFPAWVRADDLGAEPDRSGTSAFEARADFASARSIDGMSLSAIRRLAPGTMVRFTRKVGVRYAAPGGTPDLDGSFILYVPVGREHIAVALLEGEDARWAVHHPCLLEDGCITLSYTCRANEYCDEVSILARVTGTEAPPPEDPEEEWAERPHAPTLLLAGIALSDRFGTFEFEAGGAP